MLQKKKKKKNRNKINETGKKKAVFVVEQMQSSLKIMINLLTPRYIYLRFHPFLHIATHQPSLQIVYEGPHDLHFYVKKTQKRGVVGQWAEHMPCVLEAQG